MNGRRPKIISQAAFIFSGQVLSGIVLFLTMPYIALGLGVEQYGLYTVLFLLLGYSVALDFGLSFALIKHVAERDPIAHRAEIDALVSAACAVYAAVGTTFALGLLLGRVWIAESLLRVPNQLLPVAKNAVLLMALSVPFTTASTVFGALFRGLLRFRYLAMFSIANTSFYSIGAAILVMNRGSLLDVVAWYVIVTAGIALVQWIILRRLLPGFRPVPRWDRQLVKTLFGFGGYMAISQVGRIALLQLDRLVIARVLSVAMVGYYAVPFGLTQRLNMVGAATATVAFPHASSSSARGELDAFRSQHLESARVVAWLTLGPTIAVIVLADKILSFWMSPEFALHGSLVLRLLACGVFWISIASLDAVSIEGTGRPWATATFMGLTGIANLTGLLVLTPIWGLAGAATSVTVSFLCLSALDVWYFNRVVAGSTIWPWCRGVVLPTVWTVVLCLPFSILARRAVSGMPSLIIVTIGTMVMAFAGGSFFFLSSQERRAAKLWAAGLLPRKGVVKGIRG